MKKNPLIFIRVTLFAIWILSILSVQQVWALGKSLGVNFFLSWKWMAFLGGAGIVCVTVLLFFVLLWNTKVTDAFLRFVRDRSITRVGKNLLMLLFVCIIFIYLWLFIFSPSAKNDSSFIQWPFFSVISLCGMWVFAAQWKQLSLEDAFLISLIGHALANKTLNFFLKISSNPFVLAWEENYRFYYASLLASERLYGRFLPLSPVDFSLNLLNGIPFMLGDFPIWTHRLWQVVLTLGLAGFTAWALTRRLELENRLWRWLLSGFLVLYLLQEGGVKYNLLVSVAIILVGFSIQHPWRNLVVVAAASFWAGLSRANWIPVPAMLGIALYVLEEKMGDDRNIVRYLWKPVLLAVTGVTVAFGAYLLVGTLPGAAHSTIGAMLSQEFLVYRLLPNPTYAPGILIPLAILSLPMWWILLTARSSLHPIRLIALAAMMAVLLGGGVLVSIKIGGGSNLHNLDAYLVLSVLVSAYILFKKHTPDTLNAGQRIPLLALALVLIIPVWSVLKSVKAYMPSNMENANAAVQELDSKARDASQSGEVLFMYQKQLLAFGYVDVPLVPEYENVFLLDMAMSRDESYLNKFYTDLCHHRFSLIVSEPQPRSLQGSARGFGEENDIWYLMITEPLLQFYQLESKLPDAGVEFYIPNSNVIDCAAIEF